MQFMRSDVGNRTFNASSTDGSDSESIAMIGGGAWSSLAVRPGARGRPVAPRAAFAR